jgi:hypothetical protein
MREWQIIMNGQEWRVLASQPYTAVWKAIRAYMQGRREQGAKHPFPKTEVGIFIKEVKR